MKKILISLILICILISPVFAQEITTLDIIRQSAVFIFSTGNDGSGLCSGVVIENSIIKSKVLTAKHCISVVNEMYVENIPVKNIITSVDDDLALLILTQKIPNKKATKLAYYNPTINETVYHLGYPRITDEFYSEGKVIIKTTDHVYADMKIISGCSGGGVWNKDGELLGIAWGGLHFGGLFDSKVLAIFESFSDIYKFLRSI